MSAILKCQHGEPNGSCAVCDGVRAEERRHGFYDGMPQMADATKAKYSRPAVFQGVLMRFPRAIKEIAKVSAFGTQKHKVPMTDTSYMDIPDAYHVYSDAVGRHLTNEAIEGPVNKDPGDGGMLHPAQCAWDALARLEIYLRNAERSMVSNN